ncbi:uncharacterized protein LAJ45_09734 [Morchella importuna]|uniref:uncharacterized protein n=1 Tax=Morchella importuna TaxID=1174673 RepID=UPI001E8DA7A8|nr:uncharacterized protein LAJ45_09734 [Morchella importuna]KAH8146291.1 hypothetical protein LAJ45_09734 [Morchella importuna]
MTDSAPGSPSTAIPLSPGGSALSKLGCIHLRRNRANAIVPVKIIPLPTKTVEDKPSTADQTATINVFTTPGAPSLEIEFELPPAKDLTEEERRSSWRHVLGQRRRSSVWIWVGRRILQARWKVGREESGREENGGARGIFVLCRVRGLNT